MLWMFAEWVGGVGWVDGVMGKKGERGRGRLRGMLIWRRGWGWSGVEWEEMVVLATLERRTTLSFP